MSENNNENLADIEKKVLKLEEIFKKLLNSIASPAVLTVIFTSILGPIAINLVNREVETQKLQTQIVEKLIDLTKDTNFDEVRDLKRYRIYTNIITDNSKIFDIKLDKTIQQVDAAFPEAERILELQKENTKLSTDYAEEQSKREKVESANIRIKSDIRVLEERLAQAKSEGKSSANKANDLEEELAEQKKTLTQNEWKLKGLTYTLNSIDSKRRALDLRYKKLLQENEKNIQRLTESQKIIDSLKRGQKVDQDKAKELNDTIEGSIKKIRTLKNENAKLLTNLVKICTHHNEKNIFECQAYVKKEKRANTEIAAAEKPHEHKPPVITPAGNSNESEPE